MVIVDAQVHIWSASTSENPQPTLQEAPHQRVPFSKDNLLREMDADGVHRAVIAPPRWQGYRNDVVLEAARLHPDRFAVMGRLDINAPGARAKIATWRLQPGMLGLRFSSKIQGNSTDDWLWAEAEAAGVPIMLTAYTGQLHLVDQAAERHPGLKLMIDHLGIPPGTKKDERAFADLDRLLALGKHPNVAVEANSLPGSDGYPSRLYPRIRRVYDAFGPKRMFWGTDLTKPPCFYREAITLFTEENPWLTAEDREWIMGRGLCEWIGWKLP